MGLLLRPEVDILIAALNRIQQTDRLIEGECSSSLGQLAFRLAFHFRPLRAVIVQLLRSVAKSLLGRIIVRGRLWRVSLLLLAVP